MLNFYFKTKQIPKLSNAFGAGDSYDWMSYQPQPLIDGWWSERRHMSRKNMPKWCVKSTHGFFKQLRSSSEKVIWVITHRWKGHALLWEYIQLRVWGTEGSCMVADGLERERDWKKNGQRWYKEKRDFFSWRICLVRDEYDVSHIVNDAPWWFWIVVLLLRGVVGYEKSTMPKYAIDIHVFSMAFGSREKLDVSRMTRPSQTYSFAWDLGG